jgi:6-methylsalicylate decarboxylase
MTGFIDVHAHFLTGSYVAQARAAGHDVPDGMPAWPDWSAAAHLELMDRTGIDAAVLSVSSPGIHFGDDAAARQLAREVNDAGAQIVRDHPGRFGLLRPCRCRTPTAPFRRSATLSTPWAPMA